MIRSQGAHAASALEDLGVILCGTFPSNLSHQRDGTSGPAAAGGRGADDDCTADDCARGCGGLCGGGIGAACWDADSGGDDIFCLMSSSTA